MVQNLAWIRFGEIDGFNRIYDGARFFTLIGSENWDPIYNRSRYVTSLKHSITYIISHHFAKIKVDSYESQTIDKRLT